MLIKIVLIEIVLIVIVLIEIVLIEIVLIEIVLIKIVLILIESILVAIVVKVWQNNNYIVAAITRKTICVNLLNISKRNFATNIKYIIKQYK